MRNTWTLTKVRMRLAMRNRMFLFFSLVMPLGFLFFFALFFGKGDVGMDGVHPRRSAHDDRDGQLLGTERAARHVPRARHSAPVPSRAARCRAYARFQHSLELLSWRFPPSPLKSSSAAWHSICKPGEICGPFSAGHFWVGRFFLVWPHRRQRDEYDAGNADHQSADLDGVSVSLRRNSSPREISRTGFNASRFSFPQPISPRVLKPQRQI